TNEIRVREGLPPVEGGDVLLQPLNMGPTGTPGAAPAALPAPTPPTQDDTAPAGRALIEDAAQPVLTKKGKAPAPPAKKYSGKPTEFRAWADQWYTAHEPLVARVLSPAMTAAGPNVTPEEYAKQHCADSVRAITAAVEAGAGFDDLVDEWSDIRPAEIA